MSQLLAERTGLEWLDVSKLAIKNECIDEYDEEYQCNILNEDKVTIMEKCFIILSIPKQYYTITLYKSCCLF